MESETKQRSTMLTKILGAEAAGALEGEMPEAVKDTRPAMPVPMLDLVLRNGSIESFAYAYLSRVSFSPRGRLLLRFGDDFVVLQGRNLRELQQKVRLHRADEIREGIEAEEALKPESAPHVESIVFITKEEMEEQEREARRLEKSH